MERKELLCLLMSVYIFACALGHKCEPHCDGFAEDDKVPDPRNCSQYYKCMPGGIPSDQPFACLPGNEFYPNMNDCGPVMPGNCILTCFCHMTCQNMGDYVADPLNCNIFYECGPAGPVNTFSCPTDFPHYDSVGQMCSNDASVCCKHSCNPYCEGSILQVPDPEDCTKFYLCETDPSNPGPIYPSVPCETGVFNVTTGHCDSNGECITLCDSVVPPNPSSTTTMITTATSTATTPSPTTCLNDGGICADQGYFPKCNTYCDPRYFMCTGPGTTAIPQTCSDSLVFNPVASYPYCVLPNNCPFTPPLK